MPQIITWTTYLYALLPHPSQLAVLGISTPDGLVLPQVSLPEKINQSQIDGVQAGLKPVLGLTFNVLRCLAFEIDPQHNRTDCLYLLEGRGEIFSSGDLPVGLAWIGLDDLHSGLVPEVLWNKISDWLEGRKVHISQGAAWQPPPLSPPWALPGWYAQAEAWIAAEMAHNGKSVRAIEPLKSWGISTLLRVQTTTQPVFFKASLDLPLFVNEGVVMTSLAQLFPDNIPAPLSVDPEQHWMLLENLGEPIGPGAPLQQQVTLFQEMARIQINSSSQIDSLIRIGCIDRRIPWLQSHLDSLLIDETALNLLDLSEQASLVHALPRLLSLLSELDSLPIPPTLLHGDLHTGNVAIREGRIQFFDWTDAAISHPFFDLDVIFTSKDTAWRTTLREAYLSAWKQNYPTDQVDRAFDLAQVVYGLYHAISYQFILNNLEEVDRPEINSAHYFLRQVLAGLANLP